MKKKIIALVLIFLLIAPPYLFADWLNNWFNQYTGSAPDYYESQKRGYVTFGSFSGRVGTTGDPISLINIETPKIRSGCGGIDIFLGSIGFANFEYLVQKMQNLIQAAPVVAFHLALQVLSASLADVVGKAVSIIDFLNLLQFNECELLHPFFTVDAKTMENLTLYGRMAYMKYKIEEGYSDLWKKFRDQMQGKEVTGKEVAEIVNSRCPQVVKDIANAGSVLNYIASKYSIPSGFEEIARGVVGDVVINGYNSTAGIKYVDIKPKMEPSDLRENKLKLVYESGNATTKQLDLASYVSQHLISAYNAKRNKSSISNDYIKLAKLSPIPVESVVNAAVLTRNPSILPGLSPAIAQGIMYNLFLDIASETTRYLSTIPEGSADIRDCPNYGAFMQEIDKMNKRAWEAVEVVSELYKSALQESSLSLELASRILDYTNLVKSELSKNFGFSTFTRLVTESLGR